MRKLKVVLEVIQGFPDKAMRELIARDIWRRAQAGYEKLGYTEKRFFKEAAMFKAAHPDRITQAFSGLQKKEENVT